MGWRTMGWGIGLGLLALGSGCTSPSHVGEAIEVPFTLMHIYDSIGRGDEAEYRRFVQLPPDDTYSDALTTTMFESIRLHQAVDRAFATPTTARSATQPAATIAAVDYRRNAREMAHAALSWTFTVKRDRATIDQLAGQPGAPTFRRVRDRWMLVPPPWDTPNERATYDLMVQSERRLAEALAKARMAVADGTARSVEEVNAVLRNALAPTTQP